MYQYNKTCTFFSQRVWVIVDSRPGTSNQAIGIAEALGIPFITKYVQYRTTATLPSMFPSSITDILILKNRSEFRPPWPHIIITAGRRAAIIGRWIKKQTTHQVFLVQIMFPGRIGLSDFNLIMLPNHDLPQCSKNIIYTSGSPNRVKLETLATSANYWGTRLSVLPRPWVVCLVGGTSNHHVFPRYLAHALALQVLSIVERGSILLTTSRRTTEPIITVMTKVFVSSKVPLFIHSWHKESEENPYLGFLSLADAIVVTGDSVSMCTEACAQPKPVFIFTSVQWINLRQTNLHTELFYYGYAHSLLRRDNRTLDWQHPVLNPTKHVAEIIKVKLLRWGNT